MTYSFQFKTAYTFDEGLHNGANQSDPTVYTAYLVDGNYRIVVERGDYEAYVELPLREVFEKVISREWLVVKEKV